MNNWKTVIEKLETGELRSAEKVEGKWVANTAVKEMILEAFKAGHLVEESGFVDKHNLMPQSFTPQRNIRLVPGGSSVRSGAYVASGVIIMPPSYINIGAYVDEGTMVDSHALVGSCAQIGKRVHLSAGVQIGGVLEPIGLTPVIIEDDAFIGAGSVIVEGIQIGPRAVIAPGVSLSKGVPIYDCINERLLEKGAPIPANAVVVPGSRPINSKNPWAKEQGLALNCALIIKYRDEKSDASLELESLLR
ncbi:MAG: 2,3,4,5-tetrahydropyridine-2,6-dicarboxylate N-succinyltransferase [Bdellovibrionota bacterium]|nr:2,3,4,5-tetrahydropyridine-2,6-dicarboxylate N-succinyltransferase [Bdellovibrionota bacterium]|tara:strand:- start:19546 stop:20289 length:744 start_codon:yes stop_codon:yes gene_type:complete